MKSNLIQIIILGVFIFSLIVGVIVFATSGSSSQGTQDAQVVIWGTISSDVVTGVINKLNTAKPGSINLAYRQFSKEEFESSLVEAIADGTGPDAVLVPNDMILKSKKRITPIGFDSYSEREFKDTFIEGSEVLLSKEGIYGIPLLVDPLVMYWNRDMLTAKGVARPPVTWEEVLSLTDILSEKREDKSIVKSAIAFGDYSNINYAKDILIALTLQSGGQIVASNQDGTFSNKLLENYGFEVNPFTNAVSFFTQFSDPLKSVYSWNRSLPNSLQAFLNGDLAFYFDRASSYTDIKQKNPNLNFDVSVIPQPKSIQVKKTTGSVYSFSLLTSSKNLQGAFNAINMLTSAEVASVFSESLNLPPARRDLLSAQPTTASGSVFWQSALITRSWLDPNPKLTDMIFKNGVDAIVTGKSKIDESVRIMSRQFDELLDSQN